MAEPCEGAQRPPQTPAKVVGRGHRVGCSYDRSQDCPDTRPSFNVGRQELGGSRLDSFAIIAQLDPGELSQDLRDRPVGDPIAVGQALSPRNPSRARRLGCEGLGEATLADPGRSNDRHELNGSFRDRPAQCVLQHDKLCAPPDQGRVEVPAVALTAGNLEQSRCMRVAPDLPRSTTASTTSVLTASRTSASVSGPRRISPGCAACSIRAAVARASPLARMPVGASDETTSPLLIPTLIARSIVSVSARWRRLSGASARSRSAAALTARRASSSCATGAPKTATTASPMYFSTMPPWCSRVVRIALEIARLDRPPPLGVEPLAQARRPRRGRRTEPLPGGVAPCPHPCAGRHPVARLRQPGWVSQSKTLLSISRGVHRRCLRRPNP